MYVVRLVACMATVAAYAPAAAGVISPEEAPIEPIRLVYHDPSCANEADFVAMVRARAPELRLTPDSADARRFEVSVEQHAEGRWHGTVAITSEGETPLTR